MFTLNRLLCLFPLLLVSCSEAAISREKTVDTFSGKKEVATFSGGSWGYLRGSFESLEGIITVYSGYAGEKSKGKASSETSPGHKEAIQINFNPDVISYSELLDVYWKLIDPTDAGGTFHDRGDQFRSVIFYHSVRQKAVAELSKKSLDNAGIFRLPIVTPIVKHVVFIKTGEVYQDDQLKNADLSGSRDFQKELFVADHWEVPSAERYIAPSKEALRRQLTPLQYKVTQEGATEPAFRNPYDGNTRQGIYVCVVSGAPLFSSKDKFDSKTGWPSFAKPIDARFLTKQIDHSHGMTRVEVRSKFGDAHGGHVFSDGPAPTGLRYCMNSASLEFIPKENMEKKGYGRYLWLVG